MKGQNTLGRWAHVWTAVALLGVVLGANAWQAARVPRDAGCCAGQAGADLAGQDGQSGTAPVASPDTANGGASECPYLAGQGGDGRGAIGGAAARKQAESVLDPVCGMQIPVAAAVSHLQYEGQDYYFCGKDCETKFRAEPERYART